MADADKKQTSSPQNLSSSELDSNVEHCIANLKILSKIKAKDKLYYVAEGEHKFYTDEPGTNGGEEFLDGIMPIQEKIHLKV